MITGPTGDKARDVRAMFSRIAGRYDLMNSLMTFGMHTRWRAATARAALQGPNTTREPPPLPEGEGWGEGQPKLQRHHAQPLAGAGGSPAPPENPPPPSPLPPGVSGASPPPAGHRAAEGDGLQDAAAPVTKEEVSSTTTNEGEGRPERQYPPAQPLAGAGESPAPPEPTPPPSEGRREARRPLALDAGTGTGDLALAALRAGAARVVAVDFSETMLLAARAKLRSRAARDAVHLLAADAMRLPFAGAIFDCAVNGFVLRNVADLPATFAELYRVLKPGGRLACLELTHPPRLVAPIFRPYFEGIVPLMGRLVAGHPAAYRYLPASVHPFPDVERLASMLRTAGFVQVSYRRLGFGVVALHTATKPVAPAAPSRSNGVE